MPSSTTQGQPPLVEVVLGFTLARKPGSWDTVYFGKLHERLQDKFPRVETIPGAQLIFAPDQAATLGPSLELKRFSSEDGGVVVTIGPDLLGTSILARKVSGGYPGWAFLLSTGLDLLDKYNEVTSPTGIQQIGVRYINSISIDPETFRLVDYVNPDSGLVPPKLFEYRKPFSWSLEIPGEVTEKYKRNETVRLIAQPIPGGAELILDVDQQYFPNRAETVLRVRDAAELLHAEIHRIFTSVINRTFLRSLKLPNLSL